MAKKRMFSNQIIDSDAFLDMPLSTQALYFHLSMRADDDGFINNPKKIMRMIGAGDDEMKVLFTKKFVLSFDSGVIVIKHWRIHNTIQKDRYNPTVYQEELSQLTLKENSGYSLDTEWKQNGNTLETQIRLDKIRLDKIRKDNNKPLSEKNISESCQEDEKDTKPFSFKNSLLELGISKQVVNDWLIVRKNKKASNTLTAFNKIQKEILSSHLTPDECIQIAVENSWVGFKSDWVKGEKSKQTIMEAKKYTVKFKESSVLYDLTEEELNDHIAMGRTLEWKK